MGDKMQGNCKSPGEIDDDDDDDGGGGGDDDGDNDDSDDDGGDNDDGDDDNMMMTAMMVMMIAWSAERGSSFVSNLIGKSVRDHTLIARKVDDEEKKDVRMIARIFRTAQLCGRWQRALEKEKWEDNFLNLF